MLVTGGIVPVKSISASTRSSVRRRVPAEANIVNDAEHFRFHRMRLTNETEVDRKAAVALICARSHIDIFTNGQERELGPDNPPSSVKD